MGNKKIRYIGGTPIQTRITYLKRDPKLLSLIYELSNSYGINPKLPLQRLMKEGVVDNAILLYNARGGFGYTSPSVIDGKLLSAYGELGLDDSYSNIQSGRTKLKRHIPYEKSENVNEHKRVVYTAQANNNIDQLEILVAELAGIRDYFKNKYPKYTDKELDILSNAAFNMGVEATEKHIKNKTINLTQRGNYALSKELDRLNLEEAYQIYGKIGKEISDQIPGSTFIPKTLHDSYNMTPKDTRKFGGKLRYGWGGFTTPLDIISQSNEVVNPNYRTVVGSGSGRHSANYYVNQGINPDYLFGSYGGSSYIPYSEMTESQKASWVSGWDDTFNHNANGMELYTLSDEGIYVYEKAKLRDRSIYTNMQDKIDQDIIRNQKLVNNVARFGGLVGIRRKYPYGGTYANQSPYSGYIGWGTEVKPENIAYSDYEAKGEGIVGSEVANKAGMVGGIGAGIGTMAGAAAGGALGAWGGPIGMAAGALLGSLIGIFTGRKKRKEEEANRRELLAQQQEANRQNTISNMQNRYENDVAKIRTATQPTTFSGQSFYSKYGGMIKPRMKYNNGGTILPNSSDTAVAYGRTHEQVDPMTGETGITYGNAEVEGGGLVGNKELPGEVIQQTPNGDRIYSDSLYVPGTRATYAQIAKALTDKKGVIEQEISTLQETLDTSLDTFNKAKLAKAKAGTATRNIEKLASKLNLKTGELAQVDAQLNDVFTNQEQMATVLGLRDTAPVTARFGGYRPKYKFGIPEIGLGMNTLSFIGNMITTGLSAKSNLAQLDFLNKLSVPKTNKVEAEHYTIDTSPYDEASRKMAAETKRFNKWIEDNVSNPQVLRNQKRKNLINYYEGLGDINAKKSAYLTSVYDANRNARIAARNANNQGKYQDALNEYNKDMQIANARMSINNQEVQGYMATLNQLTQAFGSYGMQKMYLAQLPKGVQNEFYFGNDGMRKQLGLTGKDIRGLRRAGIDIGAMRGAFRQSNNDLDYLLYLLNS